MRIDILTLFPEMCERVVDESVIGRAKKAGILDIRCHNIRDFANNKHNRVDDTPYGGGMGMIMQAAPIYNTYQSILEKDEKVHLIYMSPKGKTLTQERAVELSKMERFAILCGHYEGVDQRVLDEIVDEEISIGDYVLTGGELPALVLADTVGRLVKGVLADDICFEEESHYSGLMEFPQYTKPAEWHGKCVPEVLLSGHHKNISEWKRINSLIETKKRRPDLFEKLSLTDKEKQLMEKFENQK